MGTIKTKSDRNIEVFCLNLNLALAQLKAMPSLAVRTNDAAALWSTSTETASQMLKRLSNAGHISRLKRNLWLLDPNAHPWKLHPFITDPAPSYISLQTALFHHGMIEQIPTTIHLVSTLKTRTLATRGADYVIHQVTPAFFTGFVPFLDGPAQIASPEKALIDFFYFRPTRSRNFRALPELELPPDFRQDLVQELVELIASPSRRRMVEHQLVPLHSGSEAS